jgi:RNA polymerase sigma-70 factor, ECF subfamily
VQPEPGAAVESALRAAQRGEVAAFNALVGIYQRQVFNICYRTLGHTEDAADATQEAFLGAFRGIKSFRGPAEGFRGWLLRIAVNACYDHLRRRQRRPSESLEALGSQSVDDGGWAADRVPDPDPGPEQQALSAETADRIQAAIQRLAPEQRLTVVLCDVQGLSYDEAAEAMGVELGTVKSRLSRGRARVRELLLPTVEELHDPGRRLEQKNP